MRPVACKQAGPQVGGVVSFTQVRCTRVRSTQPASPRSQARVARRRMGRHATMLAGRTVGGAGVVHGPAASMWGRGRSAACSNPRRATYLPHSPVGGVRRDGAAAVAQALRGPPESLPAATSLCSAAAHDSAAQCVRDAQSLGPPQCGSVASSPTPCCCQAAVALPGLPRFAMRGEAVLETRGGCLALCGNRRKQANTRATWNGPHRAVSTQQTL